MNSNLAKYNRHWERDFVYPYPIKRKIFSSIVSYLYKKNILELSGLRRVGKSTLMYQMINELLYKKIDPYHILYFTFDESQLPIEELFHSYFVQARIDYKREPVYIFLDEIQKLKNFQNQIKVYYDLYPNIKFIISGSTSFFIRKKPQESLAGRVISFVILPLFFDEYLMFCGKEEFLKKPKLYEKDLEQEFGIFLNSQFIESISMKNTFEKKEYFSSIIKKIIYEDLPSIVSFDNPSILFRMAEYIAQKPGCIINNLHFAQELQISNKTVALYLSYLEEAHLIKKFYNFSRNLITSEKRFKRYYLASPSFSLSLVDFLDSGVVFENYIASIIHANYFYRDVYQHEVDFIQIDNNKNIIPIEAKYSSAIKTKELNNICLFMNKFAITKGIVLYGGVERKTIKQGDKKIVLTPYTSYE